MFFKTRVRTVFIFFLLAVPAFMKGQLPKWIVGCSEQNSSGAFYSYGTGHLKFYELNFSGTLTSTPRVIGNSIQTIKSVGTQDVIQTAVDTSSNTVLFYAFIAALGPYNAGFPIISPDTVYFAAYNSSTSADEIFGKIPTTGWGASVLESELVRKPGSTSEYYFIYKTQATSLYNDNIRYVTINAVSKTVSAPIDIVTSTKSGEGMAVSQLDCSTNQRWLFVSRPETGGNITLRKCLINNFGISLPTDIYTISIPGNSIGVIGAIEISPTNNKLAIANFTSASVAKNLILFDYDNTTGTVSNEYSYTNQSGGPFVTMEFSPNGSRIYIMQGGASGYSNVIYNCPIVSSNYTVTSANLMTGMTLMNSLTLELAYDGKIYVNPGESSNFIYYIPNPNSTSLSLLSTSTSFFGTNQQMGSGFPDQVDGDRNPTNTIIPSISPTSTSICNGQSVSLTASGGTTYQWSGGSSSTSSTISISPAVTTTYYLEASNGSCIGSDSVTIQVNSIPIASVSGNQTICAGQSTTLTANGASSYQWSGGSNATTSTISVAPATTTNYVVTPGNGNCQGNPISIIVNVNPAPTADAGVDQTILAGGAVVLSGNGGGSYLWSPTAGLDCSTCQNPMANPLQTTTYYLTVTDSNGCTASDAVTITFDLACGELFVPSAFSPNGDTENNFECVYGKCIQTFSFVIFDRWGEKVFETDNQSICWDGTLGGKKLDTAVFAYFLKATLISGEEIFKKGNISLVK